MSKSSLALPVVYYGALVEPVDLRTFRALPRALVAVSPASGDIEWVEDEVPAHALQDVLAKHGVEGAEIVELRRGEFLMPGFVDTHTHAPQVPNIGSGQQYELLDWLEKVTFPVEARFADVDFAKKAYARIVRRYINSGTTTCCYYGTLHLEATKILADIIHQSGQRAFVGKCNMDRNSPKTYIEPSAASSITDTRALISHIHSLPKGSAYSPTHSLVHPILTPRFAISCTPGLLNDLGALAAGDAHLRIQTHVSENAAEIAFTHELFPDSASYTAVYDDHGLLRHNTVLAHAVHLSDDEMTLVKKREAGVSHCPTSNFNIRSGLAPVGEILDRGIKVSLGTDVSGGFSPSILTAIQHASICSKALSVLPTAPAPSPDRFAGAALPVPALLYLATRGGADVCALSGRIGRLSPGHAFDALVVSTRADAGNLALWGIDEDDGLRVPRTYEREGEDELRALVERFLFSGDDRNIRKVFVQGRFVGGAEFAK